MFYFKDVLILQRYYQSAVTVKCWGSLTYIYVSAYLCAHRSSPYMTLSRRLCSATCRGFLSEREMLDRR